MFKRGSAEETSSGSGIYKMTGTVDSGYTEPYAGGYATEEQEYYAMMQSVQKYNGFYIARFEAGDGEATTERTSVTVAHKVVSKKGSYVYNYVPWGAATNDTSAQTKNGVSNVEGVVELSKNMYKNSNSVVSTLCYGVQWDAIMNFVSDETHNITNSQSWGNYGTFAGSADMNYMTGSNETWKAKNIYDLAGNVEEWTMEASSTGARNNRGGSFKDVGFESGQATSNRVLSGSATNAENGLGFRPALYIK